MDDLTGPQELDDIVDVGVIRQPQDVVIGYTGLLLCCKVLCQICNQVPLHRHGGGVPREAGGGSGIDPGGMIHEVRFIAGVLHLLLRHAPGQLVNDGPHHLQMPQLLHTQRSIGNVPKYQI